MPNNKPSGVAYSDPNLSGGEWAVDGTAVTSSAAEINKLDGVTSTTAELNTVADAIASVTTATTPASGSCAVQFTFKNAAGSAISSKRRMQMFISDANGAPATAASGLAILTNGSYDVLVANKIAAVTTTAAGLLGITVTNAAGTYYLSFVLPNGTIITSSALVCNA